MELRVLTASDREIITELFRDVFTHEPWNDDWSDPVQLNEYVKEISGGYNALNYGLISDGRLIAMSLGMLRHWWEGTNYNIEEFCVAPDLQGKGTGSRFMRMIEKDIREKGLAGIFLQTDNDKPAYRFYMKNGYKELNSHVSFYKSVKE